MNALQKLEQDRVHAEISALVRMIGGLGESDAVMRFGLEDRLEELRADIAAQDGAAAGDLASAALFFGGTPVVGNKGIESEFGTKAVAIFQDLVAKQLAHETGGLGQRGVVPNKGSARLHITDVVRGSFGFVLEEIDSQAPLWDSTLKDSVDQVADLIAAFGDDDEERFQAVVAESDTRVLATAKEFFGHMRQAGATFRIVNGEKDRSLLAPAIARAEDRATTTAVDDDEEAIAGVFSVALPEGHQMEFRAEGPRGTIRGRVDRAYTPAAIVDLNRTWMERQAIGKFRVRRLLKDGQLVRESFTLLALESPRNS